MLEDNYRLIMSEEEFLGRNKGWESEKRMEETTSQR
jgi:hypothetical protein